MSARGQADARREWRERLGPTPECLRWERLGEGLTERERAHVAQCARCEAEVTLWSEFDASEPVPDEGAAVQWVMAELRRRRQPATEPARGLVGRWALWRAGRWPSAILAAAAVAVVAVAGSLVIAPREPRIDAGAAAPDVYRSLKVTPIAPLGDLDAPPAELVWSPVEGATSYDVEVLEADRTVLWRTSSREPRAALPPAVVAQCHPARTVLWSVTARRGPSVLAGSGLHRFRVRP